MPQESGFEFRKGLHITKAKYNLIHKRQFKIRLLEQEIIRTLYKKLLKYKIKPAANNIETDWTNVIGAVLYAGEAALGFKSQKSKKSLRTCSDNLKGQIDRKKQALKVYLQSENMDHFVEYKKLQAKVWKLSRKIRREDWKNFVKSLEHDISEPESRGFRVLKKVKQQKITT
jgi:uncharacterized protein YqgV (UPF0045/DUF77 family)